MRKLAKRFISLGAGVQSTTMLLLSAEGRLDKADAAIFSDTGWEPQGVYDHLEKLKPLAEEAGIPIYVVRRGSIRSIRGAAQMPLWIKKADGKKAISKRQCTRDYKIHPIRAEVRRQLGAGPRARVPEYLGYAEQWIGFSTDEKDRQQGTGNDVQFMVNRFPLLELGWSRQDCIKFLARRGWGSTPKSSCVGCPFHGNAYWRKLRDNSPREWRDAVDFDKNLRNPDFMVRPDGRPVMPLGVESFLHQDLVPLGEVDLDRATRERNCDGRYADADGVMYDPEDDVPGCSPFACPSREAYTLSKWEEFNPEEVIVPETGERQPLSYMRGCGLPYNGEDDEAEAA
jgi:hypothetical protein